MVSNEAGYITNIVHVSSTSDTSINKTLWGSFEHLRIAFFLSSKSSLKHIFKKQLLDSLFLSFKVTSLDISG
jgi:hypothetical protein